jgi:uncharacterized protein (TIGR03086 family)
MSTAPLKQAVRSARAVLDEVKPEHLSRQTPCESWKVSDLINHMIGAQYFFVAGMTGEPPSADAPDFAAGDFLAAYDQATAASIAVFEADGAMERIAQAPFGSMPGSAFIGLAITDTFTHAWDLAKSLGRSTDLAPELASGLLDACKTSIQEGFRGPEGKAPFGPEQVAPADANNADKLAAFLGRKV